jgi:hypothetical protein
MKNFKENMNLLVNLGLGLTQLRLAGANDHLPCDTWTKAI